MNTITKARGLLATLLVVGLLALTAITPSRADALHTEPDFSAVDAYVAAQLRWARNQWRVNVTAQATT